MAVANTCMRSHSALLMYAGGFRWFSLGLDLRISRIARVQVGSREKTVYVETAAAALRCFSSYNDRVYAFCPGGFCR